MPWKGEKDPYKIWISEIILQQTPVDQGLKYYNRFIECFPTIHDLAHAPEQQVFKLWEGLGYYTRCKNLIETAKYISKELKGQFPDSYSSLLKLKGIGAYTAAAISSFAYNLPYAVVDGNVFRVLSRIYDIEKAIDTTEGKAFFSELAQQLLPQKKAGEYNQAIMDFGAVICKPHPDCVHCFFNSSCLAFLLNKQLLLPVRNKRIKLSERWFHYIILQYKNTIAIRQRTSKDIWLLLYEVLLIEGQHIMKVNDLLLHLQKGFDIEKNSYKIINEVIQSRQRLTHQIINFSFLHLQLNTKVILPGYRWVSKNNLDQFGFPKTLQLFLSQKI
jgi:A/G-specific adenine glycosylase